MEWTLCTVTCGGGVRYRNRTCDMESFGDLTAPCEGDPEEIGNCHTFDCEPFGKLVRAVKYIIWLTSIFGLK